jgi:hypothetical protein
MGTISGGIKMNETVKMAKKLGGLALLDVLVNSGSFGKQIMAHMHKYKLKGIRGALEAARIIGSNTGFLAGLSMNSENKKYNKIARKKDGNLYGSLKTLGKMYSLRAKAFGPSKPQTNEE